MQACSCSYSIIIIIANMLLGMCVCKVSCSIYSYEVSAVHALKHLAASQRMQAKLNVHHYSINVGVVGAWLC